MPEVIQYKDHEDVESQEESEHGQSHEESERESASRSSGEHEGVDEELDEVDDDDEDEDPESLDFADLGNMVMYSDTRDFKGPWHVETAKVGYSHIGNSTFPIKEEFSFFFKIESKWSLQGVVAFMEDVPKENDLLCVYCECWKEKSIIRHRVRPSKYDITAMKRSLNTKFQGESAKALGFWMNKDSSWTSKKPLIHRFWNARSTMYKEGKFASFTLPSCIGVSRKEHVSVEKIFSDLILFEENLPKKGKRKMDDSVGTSNPKKPRGGKNLREITQAESSDAMANLSKKDEEKLLKTDFNKFMSMYTFGTSAVFPIAVEKIVEAPSIFVYRSVNENYVLETFKKMVEKPHITPQIADLLPYSKSKKMTVKLDAYAADKKIKMSEPEKVVKALSNDSDIVFLAISGQHSSRAQQLILQERRLPKKIHNQNCFRKSRILDGQFESYKYHDISFQDNKNNEEAIFIPSFVECLRQARKQWMELRRSRSHFKSIVTQTMGRKSHKEVIPLVCCSVQTFAAFEKFVVSWKLGKIPDVHGALGRPTNEKDVKVDRDFSQLSVNRFRPVNGLLDKELRLVWTELEKGSVCITKLAKLQGPDDIVTLKDFSKEIKGKRALGTRIVKYWETRYQEEFDLWDDLARSYNFPEKWLDGMLKFIPDKPDKETAVEETAVEDVSSSDEEEGSKKKKKPKKKSGFVEPLPSQVVTSLHRIYCAKHGEELPERLEPFAVLHLHKDISQYQLTLDEKLTCKLLVNFSSALNDMKDARALLECGAYEGDRSKHEVEFSYPCWQLVYAFVSLGPQDYKPVLVENPKLRPFSVEFEPKHADVERQVKEGDQPTNIKMKAPRWEFVGMEALNDRGLVHRLSKRAAFCSRLLANFSAEENTVLDFFSGGVFTREALLMARDVIYFANSEPEAEFVAKYSKELVRHSERVQKWFARYKAAKKSASSSQTGGTSQLASTSQAALTIQRSSPSHHDEQSKEDELAVAEDEEFLSDSEIIISILYASGCVPKLECFGMLNVIYICS
ncbi:hypothetical protein R1sor_000722 [Riccia sorocarpa]|uniref:Uncharacterized protein n=1 Tax=Riccia sorocarpa TaxID=122646 RepID=A0ABD3GX30_9MARC